MLPNGIHIHVPPVQQRRTQLISSAIAMNECQTLSIQSSPFLWNANAMQISQRCLIYMLQNVQERMHTSIPQAVVNVIGGGDNCAFGSVGEPALGGV